MTAAERGPLRVVGRYALYNEIAAGGMATVHIGRLLGPVGFARTVAVKRLHPQFAKDPEFVSMFLDEARLAARVQHPNVVATIDVVATDGELFLIMDYVRGESLSKLVRTLRKKGERVPPRIAASIVCGFLHGLHAAHEAKDERGERINLVHRDVSPQNVLVGSDGIARVLDFGIAKAAGRIQVTRDGQIKGKLAYMPPEQLAGREISRAVDIYAAGVVMWETLTGERLFKGENESETLSKILRDLVVPPSTIVPELTSVFDAPLLKALSREASRRQATARELAFELEKCVGVASATEVGDWVENVVGPILCAREDQIAQIESNSSGIRVSPSGRPEPESTESESDLIGVPSARSGTLLGVGAPSGSMPLGQPSVRRRVESEEALSSADLIPIDEPDLPRDRQSTRYGSQGGPYDSQRTPHSAPNGPYDPQRRPYSPQNGPYVAGDGRDGEPLERDGTAAKLTDSRRTGPLALRASTKLPIVACSLGLFVLLVIMGVVLFDHGSNETSTVVPRKPPISDAPGLHGTSAAPVVAASSLVRIAVPDSGSAVPFEGSSPGAVEEACLDAGGACVHSTPPASRIPSTPNPIATRAVMPAATPWIRPTPAVVTAKPPPPAPTRGRDCNPPYTLDANGRKKYKLECM